MSLKKEQLEKLNKEMLACSSCVLRGTCTQVVPGEGSPEAEIMFIGEGPGQKEDELGRPFVGAAGKFLDELLGIIKIKREDVYPHTKIAEKESADKKNVSSPKDSSFGVGVYIANVVKCRPPQNRDPLPEEAEACWPWLEKQVEIIDPKLIVLLGRHSMERFLPNQKISKIHGRAMRRKIPGLGTRIFYALYHPAAALYNGSMRDILAKDFKKIPKVLEAAKNSKNEIAEEVKSDIAPEDKQDALF